MRPVRLVFALVLVTGCPKEEAPKGRPPGDVCAEMTKLPPNCSVVPEGGLPEGVTVASNCYDVGKQLFNCGLFDQAAVSLKRSTELKADPKTWHALGEAYFLQEKWQSAQDAFGQALKADPKKRDSWLRLGMARSMLKQFDEAHAAFEKALDLDPKSPEPLRQEALNYRQAGKYDEALKSLKAAEAMVDETGTSWLVQQEVQVLQLKMRRASKNKDEDSGITAAQGLAVALTRLSTLQPPSADLQRELADARLNGGDLAGAEAALLKAAELDPKDFVSPRIVAVLKERTGDDAGARSAALASLKVAASLKVPAKQALPYLVLGRLDLKADDKVSAGKNFAAALDALDGKDGEEVHQTAALAEKVGRLEKAEALLESLDTDPERSLSLDLWLDQARVSAALKHADKVKKACEKAHTLVGNAECPPPPK
jgi:tetratricopeptide (TPR) repeat protein